jgi:hypothetical protein
MGIIWRALVNINLTKAQHDAIDLATAGALAAAMHTWLVQIQAGT